MATLGDLYDYFRAFTMSPLGGLSMEVREELWPRAKEFDVAAEIPDWLDLAVQCARLRELDACPGEPEAVWHAFPDRAVPLIAK